MEKRIRIFKSFEEQEQYYNGKMLQTTPAQRFEKLFRMQELNRLLHPVKTKKRRIIIHKHGYPK